MACPCCGAVTRAIVTSIAADAGNTFLIATPSNTVTAENYVVINGANVPVYDKYGNKLLGVGIKTRRNLHAYYGTNGASGAHLQLTKFPYCEC